MTDLYRLLPEEMEQLVIDMGYPRYRADQILLPLYYKFPKDLNDIPQLPKKLREELTAAGYTIGSGRETHRVVSEDGDTTKLLLNLTNNNSVETVLMQYDPTKIGGHPRATICVSTQIGCAMGCVFCATGQMGFETNLKGGTYCITSNSFCRNLTTERRTCNKFGFYGNGRTYGKL